MTIKELGYSIRDNTKDMSRYKTHNYYLVNDSTDEEIGFTSIYKMCKFLIKINMSDAEHLAYQDAQNPMLVRMRYFLNKISLNEKQRDYIEYRVSSDVYLKDEKRIKKFYGSMLSKLKCVKQFKEYRKNIIKHRHINVYFLKVNNI